MFVTLFLASLVCHFSSYNLLVFFVPQDLCNLLDKVDKAKGTDSKKKTFATFLSQWREAHMKLHPIDADSTVSTYTALHVGLMPGGGAIIGNTVDILCTQRFL